MQERLKIQSRLQTLREQCVKDYLQNKLEAIASKEVIHDVIIGFLQANNEQFLQNITDSILEVKIINNKLREEIERISAENKLALNRMKQQFEQIHQLEKNKMNKEVTHINAILEQQIRDYINQVHQLRNELVIHQQTQKKLKEEILQQILERNEQNKDFDDVISKLALLEKKYEEQRAKLQFKTQECKSKQAQILILYDEKLKKKDMQFQDQQNRAIKQKQDLLQKCKQKDDCLSKIKKQFEQSKSMNFHHLSREKQYGFKIEYLQAKCLDLQLSFDRSVKESQNILATLEKYKQQNEELSSLLEECNIKNIQQLEYYDKLKYQFQSYQQQTQQKIADIYQSNATQRKKYQLKDTQFQQYLQKIQEATKENQTFISDLSSQIQKLNSIIQNQKEQILTLNSQISTHIDYNKIYQEQIVRLQGEIERIRSQTKQQFETYQQLYQINISTLNNEINQLKGNIDHLNRRIYVYHQELQVQKQKEKYYQLYLSEIASLKNELKAYQPGKNTILYNSNQSTFKKINIKSRIYIIISKMKESIKALSQDNASLKRFIDCELKEINVYHSKMFDVIINKIKQQCLKCSFCEHQYEWTKTQATTHVPRLNLQRTTKTAQNYSSIKRNIQSIRQKYHQIHNENRQFAIHVDSVLNKQ